MNPTGGFNAGLSPDAVKTAIDGAMYEEFTRTMNPGYLSAGNSFFFKQGDTGGKLSFIYDEDSNVGMFDETSEQEDIKNTDSFVGNKTQRDSQKYTKQVPISDEAFRADQIGKREQLGRQIGDRARMTQDFKAITRTYGDIAAGTFFTCPDGQATASNSHTTLKGFTVDNLETGVLTPDNAWTLAVSLAAQKSQDGDPGGHVFEGAVSCLALYKTMKEVLNSTLIANSAENNLNIFDTDYGSVEIAASIYLGSQYNGATNANTQYTFVGRNHQITRKVFYGLTTSMLTPEQSANDSYAMRYKYHEVAFPGTWTAVASSSGSAAS